VVLGNGCLAVRVLLCASAKLTTTLFMLAFCCFTKEDRPESQAVLSVANHLSVKAPVVIY